MHFNVECISASWKKSTGYWEVGFRDLNSGNEYTRHATIFISAVGGISLPRDIKFPGMDKFNGKMFHTARWDHSYDYTGKRVAVIGNGCSAAQVVPAIAGGAGYIKQYARSAQWYHERPNRAFTGLEKWCFKYIPFWQRYHRLQLFLENDNLVTTYMPGDRATVRREQVENTAKRYIYSRTPNKYHKFIVPEFPLGCKRRIFDPNYLQALHTPTVELVPLGIKEFDESGIVSEDGVKTDFDLIVLATGFQVSQFLAPMRIFGADGKDLNEQWDEGRGAQAYMGSFVHNFPNFGILFGPNTFPAHNSALFSCEVQIEYVAQTLIIPILDGRAKIVEVKLSAEDQWVNSIQSQLKGSVFSAGCTNWYLNKFGRNVASWPGHASAFWMQAYFPNYKDFCLVDGSPFWLLNKLKRRLRLPKITYIFVAAYIVLLGWRGFFPAQWLDTRRIVSQVLEKDVRSIFGRN